MLRGAAHHPALEDIRDRPVKALDLGLDRRRVPADQDRREARLRFLHRQELGRLRLRLSMTRPLATPLSGIEGTPLLIIGGSDGER